MKQLKMSKSSKKHSNFPLYTFYSNLNSCKVTIITANLFEKTSEKDVDNVENF